MPNQSIEPGNAQLEHGRLTSLINSMADSVVAIDENLRIVVYNGATLNILDVNTTIQDKLLGDVLKLYDKDGNVVDVDNLIRETKIPVASRDYLLHYTDGSNANLYVSIAPVHLGFGETGTRGHVLVLRDITREKSLEEERDEFISVISHELRTPITIAEGNISNSEMILERSGNIEEVKYALREAHDQVLFLSEMINDLSTLSRAEQGTLPTEVTLIEIPELLNKLVDSYRTELDSKNLNIDTNIDPTIKALRSSELYVHEILQNFITNAIKYTPAGGLTIGAISKDDGVEFMVTDTGIGISRGDQDKIFNKFFRSEDYRTKATKGTGLGLYITKKLAHLINAEVSLTSELNKGSTFTIYIPNLNSATKKD